MPLPLSDHLTMACVTPEEGKEIWGAHLAFPPPVEAGDKDPIGSLAVDKAISMSRLLATSAAGICGGNIVGGLYGGLVSAESKETACGGSATPAVIAVVPAGAIGLCTVGASGTAVGEMGFCVEVAVPWAAS